MGHREHVPGAEDAIVMVGDAVTGIIWVGPIFQASGYGTVSRTCLLGLVRIGFPVRAINFGPDERSLLDPETRAEVTRHAVKCEKDGSTRSPSSPRPLPACPNGTNLP